jgi:hypothetical protein
MSLFQRLNLKKILVARGVLVYANRSSANHTSCETHVTKRKCQDAHVPGPINGALDFLWSETALELCHLHYVISYPDLKHAACGSLAITDCARDVALQ